MDEHIQAPTEAERAAVTFMIREVRARLAAETVRLATAVKSDGLIGIQVHRVRDAHAVLQAVERGARILGPAALSDEQVDALMFG